MGCLEQISPIPVWGIASISTWKCLYKHVNLQQLQQQRSRVAEHDAQRNAMSPSLTWHASWHASSCPREPPPDGFRQLFRRLSKYMGYVSETYALVSFSRRHLSRGLLLDSRTSGKKSVDRHLCSTAASICGGMPH